MKKILIGSMVQIIGAGGIVAGSGEVQGFEFVVGKKQRRIVVRMMRTNEIVKVPEENLRVL